MASASLVSAGLAVLSASLCAIWLSRRMHQRQLVHEVVGFLAAAAPYLLLGIVLSTGQLAALQGELRLLRLILGGLLFVQVMRSTREWFPKPTGRREGWRLVALWPLPTSLVVVLVLDNAVGDLTTLRATDYDAVLAVTVLVGAALLVAGRGLTTLPKMSPNDILQHQPWIGLTLGVLTLMTGTTGWSGHALAWVALIPLSIGFVGLAWATNRSARVHLTVEQAGTDSVLALRDALFLVRPNGMIDYSNPAALRMLGGDPRGAHFKRICPDWPCTGRTQLLRMNATRLPVLLGSAPLVVGGERVGLAISATDVSELEQALAETERAREEADAAAQARRDFLAMMSHEIRTPLNAILGLAHLLQRAKLPAEQSLWVQTICQSSDSLLTVLNDALDFARIESGKLELEPLPINPRVEIEGACRVVDSLVTAARLELVVELGTLPDRVVVDPTRLRQILLNLLSNAVKFTETGSIRVEARYADGELVVSVTDTGIGIPPERLEHLFSAFVQADRSTTRRFGGVGLGLAISQMLAQMMGGTLTVTSAVGDGSTFTLRIPAEPHLEPVTEDPTAPLLLLPSMKVLVVDDNPVNQMVLQAILSKAGLDSDVAGNGLEAVDRVLGGHYDVVFMDLQMPVKDGWDAISEITSALGPERPYLISHSAGILNDEVSTASQRGAHAHLPKPARPAQVHAALREAMRHAGV